MRVDCQDCYSESSKVDGGAAMNNFLMQFRLTFWESILPRAKNLETTALGAAFLAGPSVGYWKDLDELRTLNETGELFEPSMNESMNFFTKDGKKPLRQLKYLQKSTTNTDSYFDNQVSRSRK